MDLVVFDFCETLVNFQTANKFVNYVCERKPNKWNRFWSEIEKISTTLNIFKFFDKFFPALNISKRTNLIKLRGISEIDLLDLSQKFYIEEIKPNLIIELIELLKIYLGNNDYIVIASGGYNLYLNYFAKDYGVKNVFSTQIEIKNKTATGRFVNNKDCLSFEKIIQLNDFTKKSNLVFSNKFAYTDSISDLPLLKWANIGNVVSINQSQKWAIASNFNEIIINRNV